MGSKHLYFYDAISPIVTAESVNMDVAFRAARYGRGGDDYVNCPLTEDDYNTLVDEILSAEFVEARDFERCVWFEGCMPVEEIARRGRESLRFGPMKPVGLELPDGGGMAHAVLQLRQDDREGRLLGMVGFQTRMTWTEQRRVFRGIPGLENAEFVRMGSLHRNTFLDSPRVLTTDLQAKNRPGLFIAGQLTGVEGYVESAATGLLCGVNAARALLGQASLLPPPSTALGSLLAYVTDEGRRDFQPMNANYGLMPPLEGRKLRKRERRQAMGRRALEEHGRWMQKWPGGSDGHKERAQQA
jgi:methylenetetrahydrofolate--tRNA-(uracil-5-)-methyltransferase